MAGWGITAFGQRVPTEVLRSAGTVVQGRHWCASNAPPFNPRGEICTIAPPSYATGVCSGDSGGPLLARKHNGESVEIGIAVHVYALCSTRRPSVYTSVGAIASWVRNWIAAYRVPPPPPPSSPPATLPPPTTPVTPTS